MNSNNACDCCSAPFTDFNIESRDDWVSRTDCSLYVDGVAYATRESQYECGVDKSRTFKRTETIRNGVFWDNPAYQQDYQEAATGGYCIYESTMDPPAEISYTFPCQSPFSWSVIEGSTEGKDQIDLEERKQALIAVLYARPLSDDWYQNSGRSIFATYDSGLSAYRAEYRISHQPYPSCYLKIWFSKLVYSVGPSSIDGATFVETALPPYVWSPLSTPCIPDSTKPPFASENLIYSPTYTIGPNDQPTNHTTFIIIKKWSYLKDYEPDDPIIESPFSVLRPETDCRSNGIPTPYNCL